MDADGLAGEQGEVLERASGDDRHVGLRHRREGPDRNHRLAVGPRIARIGDDLCERAVVVGTDQQDGGTSQEL